MVRDKNECTIGVTLNGDDIEIKRIQPDYRDVIFQYSSVFSIRLFSEHYGNGKYKIYISQPNRTTGNVHEGMSFNTWTIDSAEIGYDWNNIWVSAKIFDETVNFTNVSICSYRRPWAAQSLDLFPEETVKRIVSRVREIDTLYPDVASFEAVTAFLESRERFDYMPTSVHGYVCPINDYIRNVAERLELLKKVQSTYESAKNLLQSYTSDKAKQLLIKLDDEIESITKNQSLRIYKTY